MKITTLIENSLSQDKSLRCEHGLSFYIETKQGIILFDTGKSGDFIENANKLHIDLNKIDYMALSHAHYDHCGGVRKLFDNFKIKPDFYVSDKFFENSNKYYHSTDNKKLDFSCDGKEYRYIGIDFDKEYIEDKGIDIRCVKDSTTEIAEGIYLFSKFNRENHLEKINESMKIKIDGNYVTDNFDDEIALGIDTDKGLVILLGCAHPGILNMVENIMKSTGKTVYGVIGGTHLVEADEERIRKTIKRLNELNIRLIGVSHCTGESACNLFQEKCDNFFKNSTGTIIEL